MDFTELVDLASERLGGVAVCANDEFFAPKENLLKSSKPVFIEGKYTDVGKWMDGWETRRRRTPGFDWCIIRLGLPGILRGFVVDTSHFKGNYPEHCSIEACSLEGQPDASALTDPSIPWIEVLPKAPLQGDSENRFVIQHSSRVTHLRFKICPDGGVARLRAHGEVIPDWSRLTGRGSDLDLAAVEHGGLVVASSDMFFGSRNNLIMPGRAAGEVPATTGSSSGWEPAARSAAWTLTLRISRAISQKASPSKRAPSLRRGPKTLPPPIGAKSCRARSCRPTRSIATKGRSNPPAKSRMFASTSFPTAA